MADNFVSKSVLFEVVNSSNGKIEKSFTLVLPPQSYQIKEKHRVSITKTFGNAFIDDYGADNLEITIKGISGTAHVFPTFRTGGVSKTGTAFKAAQIEGSTPPTEGYRHIEAFYTFRDDIMRYRDHRNFDQKELRVYDLADEQAYKCVLLEFILDRNADKPFHYPFTISLFVYARLNSKQAASPQKIKISQDPIVAFDQIDYATASLEFRFKEIKNVSDEAGKPDFSAFDRVQDLRNKIAEISRTVQQLRNDYNTWLTQTAIVLQSPLLVSRQLHNIMIDTVGIVYDAYVAGRITLDSYINIGETLDAMIRQTLSAFGFAIEQGAQQSLEEVIEVNEGMDFSAPATPVVVTTQDRLPITGVWLYTVKEGDVLLTIAEREMGDSSLWPFIVSVNKGIRTSADLVVGEQIYIPVTAASSGATVPDNFVLTEDPLRDPYGADLRIDENGTIMMSESNDVTLISGVDNVIQAVNMALATPIGSMISQTTFGLATQVGVAGTAQALSYARMSVEAALIQDPRIESIENVVVSIDRDTLIASADLILVGQEDSLPVSVVMG